MIRSAAAALLVILVALPAQAHTTDELREWEEDWNHQVTQRGALTVTLMAERRDIVSAHPRYFRPVPLVPEQTSRYRGMGNGTTDVEAWRSVVSIWFGPRTEAALRVMACESGGNKFAQHPGSKASGLFQFLPSTWHWLTGQDSMNGVWDGARNTEMAWRLSEGGTDWSQWVCQP